MSSGDLQLMERALAEEAADERERVLRGSPSAVSWPIVAVLLAAFWGLAVVVVALILFA